MSAFNVKFLALPLVVGAFAAMQSAGRVSMTLTGGKTGSAEMRDAGFCVTDAKLGSKTMHIFAFASNNAAWSISISSTSGMPGKGTHVVDADHPEGVTAQLIDKTTGKQPVEWTRYDATEGSVIVTRNDADHFAGSFRVTGKPSWPKKDGAAVTADGTFDASPTAGCDQASKGKPEDAR